MIIMDYESMSNIYYDKSMRSSIKHPPSPKNNTYCRGIFDYYCRAVGGIEYSGKKLAPNIEFTDLKR